MRFAPVYGTLWRWFLLRNGSEKMHIQDINSFKPPYIFCMRRWFLFEWLPHLGRHSKVVCWSAVSMGFYALSYSSSCSAVSSPHGPIAAWAPRVTHDRPTCQTGLNVLKLMLLFARAWTETHNIDVLQHIVFLFFCKLFLASPLLTWHVCTNRLLISWSLLEHGASCMHGRRGICLQQACDWAPAEKIGWVLDSQPRFWNIFSDLPLPHVCIGKRDKAILFLWLLAIPFL